MSKASKQNFGECTDCGTKIGVRKDSHSGLELSCQCGTDRSVRVRQKTPEGWDL